MAITYTSNYVSLSSAGVSVTSGTLTITAGDVITVMHIIEENTNAGTVGSTLNISNSGTALTWNLIGSTNTADNCKIVAWYAIAGTTQNRTVTCTTEFNKLATIACVVHTGAHATTPVPGGNVFSATATTDASQSITPTATGSALWMAVGDWNATNSFTARTNCTLANTNHVVGQYTNTVVRPTTQPRTDANAFTIGETDTSSNKVSWLAFEVRAAAGTAYTLTAAQGSFSITGQSANLLAGYGVAAAQGSYAITGQSGNALTGYLVSAAQGALALNGQDAALAAGWSLPAAQGSYALTGQDAAPLGAFSLSAAQGSFSISGQDAATLSAFVLPAAQGAYSLTGQDSSGANGYTIVAAQGAFSITGQAAAMAQTARNLAAEYGAFTLNGQGALFASAERTLAADGTLFSVFGGVAVLTKYAAASGVSAEIDGRPVNGIRWLMAADGTIIGYRNTMTDSDMRLPLNPTRLLEVIDRRLGSTSWRD